MNAHIIQFRQPCLRAEILTHPSNIHILSRTGDERRDIAIWADEACADQVGTGDPRKYAIVFFRDTKLFRIAKNILCNRERLPDLDVRIGKSLDDKWGVCSSSSHTRHESQNVMTPWHWHTIDSDKLIAYLSEQLSINVNLVGKERQLEHRFCAKI